MRFFFGGYCSHFYFWRLNATPTGLPTLLVSGLSPRPFLFHNWRPFGGYRRGTMQVVLEFIASALLPTLVASVCWDASMRRGQVVFVSAFSFCAPLIATLTSAIYLGVPLTWTFLIAAVLVMGGGVMARYGVRGDSSSPKPIQLSAEVPLSTSTQSVVSLSESVPVEAIETPQAEDLGSGSLLGQTSINGEKDERTPLMAASRTVLEPPTLTTSQK